MVAVVLPPFPSRRGLLLRAVRKDLAALDRVPVEATGSGPERRVALRYASLRLRGDEASARVWARLVAAALGIFAINVLGANIRAAATRRSVPASSTGFLTLPLTNLLLGIACAVVGGILVFELLRRTIPIVKSSRGRTWAAGLAFPCARFPLRPIFHSMLVLHSTWWYWWQGYAQVSFFLALGLGGAAALEMLRPWWRAPLARPTDRLLLLTMAAAGDVHTRTRRRLTAATSRRLCAQLEHLAYVAERDLSLPRRAPRGVRRGLRQDALRIAAVYRAHQQPLLLVRNPQDADPLVTSLLAAADALAAGDRAALLANAPDQVVERNLIRRILSRAWPATVLILCGVLLPLLPSVAQQPAAANSLRWTFVIAGALTWVAGTDMASRVGGPLEKVLPWR